MKLINSLRIILLIIIISHNINCFSQNWPKIYGDNIQAYGEEILESYDKGYFICGSILKDAETFEYGWLIKTDINGNIIWDKRFGDDIREDYFLDFDKTLDNGLVISGVTSQIDIENDPLFVKLDPCGEIEWCKIYSSDGFNAGNSIVALPNGEYIGMLRYYGGDPQNIRISLVKMDSSGEPIWIKHIANGDTTISNEDGYYLYFTPDANLLITGRCFSPSIKPFVLKTDSSGTQLWDIKWPVGSGGWADQCAFASNGMIYSATGLQFTGHPRIPYLLKFNESGDIITQYPLLGDTIYRGGAESLLLIGDTSMYVGLTWTDDPDLEELHSDILKTDSLGNMFFQRRLIEGGFPPTSIIKSYDNKILVIGKYYVGSSWDIDLWKMNSDLEDDTLYTQPLTYDSLCPYQILSDTVDLDCSLFVNIDEIPTKEEYESTIKISPNPARDWISLSLPDVVAPGIVNLEIYNIFGQEILKTRVTTQNRMTSLNVSNLPSGFYLAVCMDTNRKVFKGKFIVAR